MRNRAMIELMYYYGLRNREVAALKVEHIDFDFGCVEVPGVRRREIWRIPKGRETLHLYTYEGRPLIKGSKEWPWYFISENGGQMGSDEIMQVLDAYVERADLSSRAKHETLLHSRAVHMLYDDEHLDDIQWMLGFKDLKELTDTYRRLAAYNKSLQNIEEYLVQ